MAVIVTYAFRNIILEFNVNTTIAGDQTNATLARLSNGNVAYFYQDDEAVAPNENILGRYLTTGGANNVSEFTMQITGGDREITPQAAALTNGNVVVVYEDSNASGSAGGTSVAFRIFNQAGAVVSVNGDTFPQLVENEPDDQTAPVITALSGGGFVIALLDQNAGSATLNALGAYLFGNDGVQIGGRINVRGSVNNDPHQTPAIASLSDGGFVVVWAEDATAGAGTNYDIKAQRYTASGVPSGGIITIDSETDIQTKPTVAGDSSGGFMVAWQDEEFSSAALGNIDFVHVSAGGIVGSKGSVTATNLQSDPSLALLSGDIFVMTYTTTEFGNEDIKAVALQGSTILATYDLETLSANNRESSVISTGNGEFMTAWTDFGSGADGNGSGIQSQRDRLARTTAGDGADDVISGDDLRDIINGGGGNDFITGAGGPDSMVGGTGFDSVSWFGEAAPVLVNLTNQSLNAFAAAGDTASGFEAYYLTNSADSFTNDGNGGFIYGFGGGDIIVGGAGSDFIEGGTGGDNINAAGGFDYVSYANAAAGVRVDFTNAATNTGEAAGDVITGAEAFYLSAFGDVFIGQSGQNIVFGGGGSDNLFGGINSSDWLFGEAGNDFISGGNFNDLLSGGADADTYAFTSSVTNGFDSILDFTPGQDRIQLTGAGFSLLPGGLVNGANFVSGAAPVATFETPTVIYNTTFGILLFDLDGTGGGSGAVNLAQIAGAPVLTASDFLIV